MLTRWIVGGCLAAGLALPSTVLAQAAAPPEVTDQSLEALMAIEVASVVGAAKHEQRVTEAPSSVTVITAADIRTFGWRTMADVLRSVRGFYITYDRNYTYLGARGFGRPTDFNNRVLIMLDGHRTNDNIYDGASIGTEGMVDLDLVERIEVIRGPGSALYGTSAFFAVVNIITRRGGAIGGVEVSAEAGLEQSYRARATAGRDWGTKGDLMVSATRLDLGGQPELYYREFDTPDTGNGRALGMDGESAYSMLANARVGQVKIQSAFSSRTKSVPTASWGTTFGDPRYRTEDRRGWVDATYERQIGTTHVAGRAYVDWMNYDGVFPGDEVLNMDSSAGTWLGGEIAGTRRVGSRHRVTAGLEQRFNVRQEQDNRDEPTGVVYVDDARTSAQSAVYVQDEITLARRWTATLGARLDWWSVGPGSLRPRAGLVYRTESDLAVKLLYGEAFRAANAYEMFYVDPSSQPNPTLRPERLQTSEIVFEQYLQGRVRLTAAGFLTRIDDLIDQVEDDGLVHVNRASAGARGVEGEAEYRSAAGVLVRGSLVAQQATEGDTDTTLSNAPERLGTLQIAAPVYTRDVTLALDTTYVGQRLTRTGQRLDSFWLSNVIATWRPRQTSLIVQAGLYNLFDRVYAHPVGAELLQESIDQNRRTFSVKASVRF